MTRLLAKHDVQWLAEQARHAAHEAGTIIAASVPTTIEHKPSANSLASAVVTDVDRKAEQAILDALAPTIQRFDLGVLSEERPDNASRLAKSHFWCIDPLDGTLPFTEGNAGFAVSIALVRRDGTPLIGVVFDPVGDTLYEATLGIGITRNGQSWTPQSATQAQRLSVFIDRSFHASANYQATATALATIADDMGLHGVDIHTQAGAVMNACQVLHNAPACYFKFPKSSKGGGSLWDFAATACLSREAGAVATDIRGNTLDLNRPDSTFMNHRGVLFATDVNLANRIRVLAAAADARARRHPMLSPD